MPQN